MSLFFLIFLLVFLLIPAVGVCVYHLFLGFVGLFLSQKTKFREMPTTRFAFLIPAHNEHGVIEQTLQSCLVLDYPKELLEIYVVADNCSDDTAEIARSFGVNCLERQSETDKGKGFALAWGFPKILAESKCDAVLVLDADCLIDSHALKSLDYHFTQPARGETCFQINYVVGNPDQSPLSYLLAVANYLENDSFYSPISALGNSVLLRGTGMLFPRNVLERNPWNAFSIVEDTEYTLQLIRKNIDIRFVPETRILSEFPSEQKTLTAQRSRWIGGNLGFCIVQGIVLIVQGIVSCRFRLIPVGWTLLLLSRPLILFHLGLATFFSVLFLFWEPAYIRLVVPLLIFCWGGYAIYFAIGVSGLGLSRNRVLHCLRIPVSILSYLAMSFFSILKKAPGEWTKTPRNIPPPNDSISKK